MFRPLVFAFLLLACTGETTFTPACEARHTRCLAACETAPCQAACDAPYYACLAELPPVFEVNVTAAVCAEFSGPITVNGNDYDGVTVWRGPVLVTLRDGADVVDIIAVDGCLALGPGEGG